MRMVGEQRLQDPVQRFTAVIERTADDLASSGDNLKRRRDRGDVPAGIALGIFVARGQIDAALGVELAQKSGQAARVGNFRNGSRDGNPARRQITFGAHTDAKTSSITFTADSQSLRDTFKCVNIRARVPPAVEISRPFDFSCELSSANVKPAPAISNKTTFVRTFSRLIPRHGMFARRSAIHRALA